MWWSEPVFIQYFFMVMLSVVGCIFFIWEYFSNGQELAFRYVGLLLFGLAFHLAGMTYMRYLFLTKSKALHLEALGSWWWMAKEWAFMVILFLVVFHFYENRLKRE